MPDNEENEFGDSKEVQELVNDVLKFGRPHCSQIQEQEEFDKILYVRASMFRHLVWNQWSHESQQIPFWLILTGCEHSMHGYFHLGPGFR